MKPNDRERIIGQSWAKLHTYSSCLGTNSTATKSIRHPLQHRNFSGRSGSGGDDVEAVACGVVDARLVKLFPSSQILGLVILECDPHARRCVGPVGSQS